MKHPICAIFLFCRTEIEVQIVCRSVMPSYRLVSIDGYSSPGHELGIYR